jgi:exodeoxyribonuclease V gamma subunit
VARGDKLVGAWLRQLAAAAVGQPLTGYLVARDAIVTMAPLEPSAARATLDAIGVLWRRNLDAPLPVACKTALALLAEGDPRTVYQGGFELSGEVEDEALARLWPDYATLERDGRDGGFVAVARELYGPLAAWLDQQVRCELLGAVPGQGREGGAGDE